MAETAPTDATVITAPALSEDSAPAQQFEQWLLQTHEAHFQDITPYPATFWLGCGFALAVVLLISASLIKLTFFKKKQLKVALADGSCEVIRAGAIKDLQNIAARDLGCPKPPKIVVRQTRKGLIVQASMQIFQNQKGPEMKQRLEDNLRREFQEKHELPVASVSVHIDRVRDGEGPTFTPETTPEPSESDTADSTLTSEPGPEPETAPEPEEMSEPASEETTSATPQPEPQEPESITESLPETVSEPEESQEPQAEAPLPENNEAEPEETLEPAQESTPEVMEVEESRTETDRVEVVDLEDADEFGDISLPEDEADLPEDEADLPEDEADLPQDEEHRPTPDDTKP